jgi:hypothetical protein
MAISLIPNAFLGFYFCLVKICFLTASEMYYEEIRKQVFPELEANCFIGKPVANEDLIRSVKNILEIQ